MRAHWLKNQTPFS